MNAIKDSTPPTLPAQKGDNQEGPLIGVRLLLPEEPAALFGYPAFTHGVMQIMCHLLQARIEAAGCPVAVANSCLPFYRSLYIFELGAKKRCIALKAVSAELADLKLLEWAQVAWDDVREGIWRLHYPKIGEFSMPSEAELATAQAQVAAVQAQVVKAGEAIKKRLQRLQDGSSG